jgi:hypothetical protein
MSKFSYLTIEAAAVALRGDQWSAIQVQGLIGLGEGPQTRGWHVTAGRGCQSCRVK